MGGEDGGASENGENQQKPSGDRRLWKPPGFKPGWWRWSLGGYCVFLMILAVTANLPFWLGYLCGGFSLVQALLTLIVIPAALVAYYMRVKGGRNVWRAVWILAGASWFWLLMLTAAMMPWRLGLFVGDRDPYVILVVSVIAISLGAYLGNKVGRRRWYRPLG